MTAADRNALRDRAKYYRARAATSGSALERDGWNKLADYLEQLADGTESAQLPRPRHSC